jgi:hypothetical protein
MNVSTDTSGYCYKAYLVVVGILDSLVGVALCKALSSRLAVDVILSTGICGKVGALYNISNCECLIQQQLIWSANLVDESTTLGVGTSSRGLPKCAAKIDMSEADHRRS